MPLKFLRLPQLIQSEIVDNLMPEDIFLLSLCSQNSFNVLQSNFRKTAKLKITVVVSTSLCARYNLNGSSGQFVEFSKYPYFCRSFEDVTIDGNRMLIQYVVGKNSLEAKLIHNSSNVKSVMNHLSNLFQRTIHYVKFHGDSKQHTHNFSQRRCFAPNFISQVNRIFSILKSIILTLFRKNVQCVELYGEPQERTMVVDVHPFGGSSFNGDDDWFSFTQDMPQSIEPLYLQASNSLQTDLDLFKRLSWETVDHLDTNVAIPTDGLKGVRETIWLKDASFVTLDDLMNMDQVEIYLEKSNLTNLDINRFVNNWKRKEGNPRVRLLHCQLRERANFDKIFRGIQWNPCWDKIRKFSSIHREEGSSSKTPDGVRSKLMGYFALQDWSVAGEGLRDKITLHFNHPKPDFEPQRVVRSQPAKSYIPLDYFS